MDYDISKTDLISILLDKENKELLPLEDESGNLKHFKQLATVRKGTEFYCLLKPINNSAFPTGTSCLFKITKSDGHYNLSTKIDNLEKEIILDKIKSFIPVFATEL